MAIKDVFEQAEDMLKQSPQEPDLEDSDDDYSSIDDYVDDDGNEILQEPDDFLDDSDFYDGAPEEENEPEEDERYLTEEQKLLRQKQCSADWANLHRMQQTDVSEQDYVMNRTGCTAEEFQNRKEINDHLELDVTDVLDYNEVSEDVLAEIARLAPNEQTKLAADVKDGTIDPYGLTRAYVLGYREGVQTSDFVPDEEDSESEENYEPEDELEQEFAQDETSADEELYEPESSNYEDDLEREFAEEDSALNVPEENIPEESAPDEPEYTGEAEEPAEPEETYTNPFDSDSEPEEIYNDKGEEPVMPEEMNSTPAVEETNPAPTAEAQEEQTPRRYLMSVNDFQELFQTFEQAEALISETVGSTVSQADYERMSNDINNVGNVLTRLANYYLDNAVYPFNQSK